MNQTLPTGAGETGVCDEIVDPNYRVIHPGLLDRPQVRAALLGTILIAVGIFVSAIRWETPEDSSGVFEKVHLQPAPPPPLPPRAEGGRISMPDLPAPPMAAITAPTPHASFVLPPVSRSILANGLAGVGRFNGAGGLGIGLGTQLSGLLFQLPCLSDGTCNLTDVHYLNTHLSDDATHICRLHVRGVVEVSTYEGGLITGYLSTGGIPNTRDWNIYELDVNDPPQTYYLNAGVSGLYNVYVLNYTFNIQITNGSVITLRADSVDSKEITNQQHLSAPNDDPSHPIAVKQPYYGQFIQVDAISIQ